MQLVAERGEEMMSERNMKIVGAFERLPSSPIKEAISKSYIADEICTFDFLKMAEAHLKDCGKHPEQDQSQEASGEC